jgi:glycerate kinase
MPKIICFSDVENKLFGRLGSAQVYGPQKGANKKEVVLIDSALKNFQKVIGKNLDKKFYGASGALPAALCGVLKAKITKGTQEIFKLIKAENLIKKANLVVTSEGCLDEQSLFGKAPFEILKLAKKHKKQVLFICGKNKLNSSVLKKYTNLTVAELCALAKNNKDSFVNAKVYLKKVLGDLYEYKH